MAGSRWVFRPQLQQFKWRGTPCGGIAAAMTSTAACRAVRSLSVLLATGVLALPFCAHALVVLGGKDIPRAVSFGGPCVGCDLSGRQLSGARFLGADFSGSALVGANLRAVHFTGADFSGSDLSRSDLSDAEIYGADFDGARMKDVRLDGARIRGASFSGADFEGASFKGAVFQGVDLSAARNLRQEQLDVACAIGAVRLPRGLGLRACARD